MREQGAKSENNGKGKKIVVVRPRDEKRPDPRREKGGGDGSTCTRGEKDRSGGGWTP